MKSNEPAFKIGDHVYRAFAGPKTIWITCPECCGSGRLRIILGDDSEVSIPCVCCERGYEGSPGKIQSYSFHADVSEFEISGVESVIEQGNLRVRYSGGCWSIRGSDVFATPEEALRRAEQLTLEHQADEARRLRCKEKQTRTWAWNVSYWRKQIRDAEKTINRAKAKLSVAPKNPKLADKLESSDGF